MSSKSSASIKSKNVVIFVSLLSSLNYVDCWYITEASNRLTGGTGCPICQVFGDTQPFDKMNSTFRIKSAPFFGFSCTADYPMDFSFDGQRQDGDDIDIAFTREVVGNTQCFGGVGVPFPFAGRIRYNAMLTIGLVSDKLTGNYSIFSVGQPARRTSVYLFIEKSQDPPYLFQTTASHIIVDPKTQIATVPCRTTKYDANVVLYKRSESKLEQIGPSQFVRFDPKVGFMWNTTGLPLRDGHGKPGEMYICQTNYTIKDSIEWKIENSESVEDDIRRHNEVVDSLEILITVEDGKTQLECKSTGVDGAEYLSNIKAANPRLLSVIAGCASQGRNCLHKLIGIRFLMGTRIFIRSGFPYGLAYCSEAGSNRTLTKEYFRGLDDKIYYNWEDARDANALIEISAVNKKMLYSNLTYRFNCTVQNYILTEPIFFTLHFKNGSFKHSVCIRRRRVLDVILFSDIYKLSCSSAPWNSSVLINSSITLALRDRVAPAFEVKEARIRLALKATNQQLRCVANGDETPDMNWERNGTEITSDESKGLKVMTQAGYSTLNLLIVWLEHSGIYECVAQNSIGKAYKRFHVQVTEPEPEESNHGVILGIVFGLLSVLFVTIMISYIFFRHFYKNQLYLTPDEIEEFKGGIKGHNASVDPTKQMENIQYGPYNSDYEIQSNQYQLDRSSILGSGQFGIVYRGLYNHTPVAVKTVKSRVAKMYLKALLSELKVMIYINGHENIVHLFGADTEFLRNGIVYVFVELCLLGDLEGFLRGHQHNFINQITSDDTVEATARKYTNVIPSVDTLYTKDLVLWSFQICSAMEYLVIHGDLAARNVLLANRETAKITDFGLARKLYNHVTYVKKKQEPLPWRSMAIESLRSLIFSTKSDVWAFGVLLWEIFTLGDVPYLGLSWSVDFVEKLQNNLRMTKPRNCCSGIYGVMLRCWEKEPEDRPSFELLSQYFSIYLSKFAECE